MWENWRSVRIYDFLTIKHVLGGKVRIQGKIYKCLKWKSTSRVWLFGTPWSQRSWSPILQADSLPAEPPGKPKNTGEGSLFFLQQIFLIQESKWRLLRCRWIVYQLSSVELSSAAQSCPTLWDPMNRSMPGLPVHHQLLEFTQTHAHRVGDTIQSSHPLSSPSPASNPSQQQGLYQWVNSSHEVAKVLEFQLQHQSFQWTPRTDLLQDGLVGSLCSPRDS